MRSLSIAKLNEHLDETETDVRRFSEELVQQLALRDELDFEKEVKNAFISALIDVQNRQKEQREMRRKKKRNPRGGAGTPQGGGEKSLASVSFAVSEEETIDPDLPPDFLDPRLLHAVPPQRFGMEALSSAIQSSFRQTFGSSCGERQVNLVFLSPRDGGDRLATRPLLSFTLLPSLLDSI